MSDYFIFDDIDTRNYKDILVYFNEVDTTPKRVGEFIQIPNRNGSFFLDGGRYEDATHTYDIVALSKEDASDLINALASKVGYFRLQDSFNTDEFYSAVFNSEIEPKITKERDKLTFKVTFTRKPQRWLTSGETAVTIGEWRDTETVTGDIVEVENPDEILGVKSLSVALAPIQDLNGYSKPWAGGAGKNKLPYPFVRKSTTASGITFTDNGDGTLTINGTATASVFYDCGNATHTFKLKSGTYTFNGSGNAGVRCTLCKVVDGSGSFFRNANTGNVTFTIEEDGDFYFYIVVNNGTTLNNLNVKLQLEEGSTATSWTPYSNICPISGRTEVVTQRTGKNLLDDSKKQRSGNQLAIGYSGVDPWTNGVSAHLKAGTYTFSVETADGTNPAAVYVGYSGETGHKFAAYSNKGTFTLTEEKDIYVWAYKSGYKDIGVDAITHAQLELGSTATSYEPYNGNTYTTALGRTVYGGTLDVVSGVLTVDRIIDIRNTADMDNAEQFPGWRDSVFNEYFGNGENVLINAPLNIGSLYGLNTIARIGAIWLPTNIYGKTQTEWIAMAMDVQITIPLATPQTYQLTPQEVALLKGTNNVWSDSGDITLEYGQLPNLLINPTLFESSPLLEIEGYGSIGFNGYEIEIDNTDLGEVVVYPRSLPNANITITIDTQYLNQGDSIYFGKGNNDLYFSYLFGSGTYKTYAGTVSSQVNVKTASVTNYSSYGLQFKMTPDTGTGFVYGTPRTINSSLVFYYTNNNIQYPQTVNTSISYDGNDSITFSYARTGTESSDIHIDTNPYVCINKIYAFSTSPIDIGTIYVDCDLGECYLEESGTITPINQQVDLGSRLPTLASGTNEIIFDNTITELNIVPRWWKV